MASKIRLLGSTSSGTLIYPPADSIQSTYGIRTPVMVDHFLDTSTIDMANTHAAGFNWYLEGYWPNSTSGDAAWNAEVKGGASVATTAASNISVSNSILTMSNAGGTVGYHLFSGVWNASLGAAVGNFWGSQPSYVECMYKYTPGTVTSPIGDNGFWAVDKNFLLGSSTLFNELDVLDTFPQQTTRLTAVHEWNTSGTDTRNDSFQQTQGGGDTSWHRYGVLIVPASFNSGTGIYKFYIDGVSSGPDVTYTAGNTNSHSDGVDFEFIVNCAGGTGAQNVQVDYVAAWGV